MHHSLSGQPLCGGSPESIVNGRALYAINAIADDQTEDSAGDTEFGLIIYIRCLGSHPPLFTQLDPINPLPSLSFYSLHYSNILEMSPSEGEISPKLNRLKAFSLASVFSDST